MKLNKKYILSIILIIAALNLFAQTQDFNDNLLYNISVVGAVENPGVYSVTPVTHVSEALKLANVTHRTTEEKITEDIEETENLEENEDIASTRNVYLKRNGKTRSLDLQKFFILGKESENPFLQDGDVIIVPAINGKVSIYGAINKSGDYEYVQQDKIYDIIQLAMGLTSNASTDKGELVRFNKDGKTTTKIEFDLGQILEDPQSSENLTLQNDDRIFIRSKSEFHQKKFVKINGEIKYPGTYAIDEDKTTLFEILKKSGGPTTTADLDYAILQRKSKEDIIDPEFERLKKMNIQEMTVMEYEYFKTQLRQMQGKVAVDFSKLWNNEDSEQNLNLKNKDFIYIPEQISTVSVSGQVNNPGLLTYVPGKDYMYYISQSGGYSWNARKGKIRIIKADTGKWIKPDEDTPIEAGDMIFIPEKPDIDYWELTKDIVRIVSEVATIVVIVTNVLGN